MRFRLAGDLRRFLSDGAIRDLTPTAEAEITIVCDLDGMAELVLPCLDGLRAEGGPVAAWVFLDNDRSGRSRRLSQQIRGATILAGAGHDGDARAVSRVVATEIVAFVDHRSRIEARHLVAACRRIRGDAAIAAVGGRTVLDDGTIREAGSILWGDGSRTPYARGLAIEAPEAMFVRDVDAVWDSLLLTRKSVWDAYVAATGGRARVFPAGVEAFALWMAQTGGRWVYDPEVVARRQLPEVPGQAGALNRVAARPGSPLGNPDRPLPQLGRVGAERSRAPTPGRLIFFDDRVPDARRGQGDPRTLRALEGMVHLGYAVTYYPLREPLPITWAEIRSIMDERVEVMLGRGLHQVADFLRERLESTDLLFVSRPHNMGLIHDVLAHIQPARPPVIVYDAEAIFGMRVITQRAIEGHPMAANEAQDLVGRELDLTRGCRVVASVSEREGRNFREHGVTLVYTLSHAVELRPTPRRFEDREGLLFVGPILSDNTPNTDSLAWFGAEVLPRLRETNLAGSDLRAVGGITPELAARLSRPGLEFVGKVDDLTPFFDRTRVFIAPTRFAAGIPLKILDAAAHGVPVVTTPLLAEQLGWQHETELLVAADAADFAAQCGRLLRDSDLWLRIRAAALERIAEEYSRERFGSTLRQILETARSPHPPLG